MTTRATEHPTLFNADMVRAILAGTKTQTRRPVKFPESCGFTADGFPFQAIGYCDCRKVEANDITTWIKSPFGVPGDTLWVRETWIPKNWSLAECNKAGCPDAATHPTEVMYGDPTRAIYRASYIATIGDPGKWTPSIHMPRWASRINLPVTRVWVGRVQDITDEDAAAEGLSEFTIGPPKQPIVNGVVAAGMVLGFCTDLTSSRRRFLATCGSAAFAGVAGWLRGGRGNFPMSLTCRQGFALVWDSIYAEKGLGWDVNPWIWGAEFPAQQTPEVTR